MNEFDLKIFGGNGTINSINDFFSEITVFSKKYNIIIQVFDADMIFGENHILSAFKHAIRSMQQDNAVTHSLSMELLLYVSGERQIKRAIKKMGIKEGKHDFVVVFIYPLKESKNITLTIDTFLNNFELKRNDSLIKPDKKKLIEFGITKESIFSVRSNQVFQLVLEKIALVDVIK